jgi:hypothetical protein
MSATTLAMRKAIRGESLCDWLKRQREVDNLQMVKPLWSKGDMVIYPWEMPDFLLDRWIEKHGWGDAYDDDEDDKRLLRIENTSWRQEL